MEQSKFRIAIMAVNEDCEEAEVQLVQYLAQKIAAHNDAYGTALEAIPFDDEMSAEEMAEQEADRTVVVFDAVRGMNSRFAHLVYALFDRGIVPILLISNSDDAMANLYTADNALEDLRALSNSSCNDPCDPVFHTLYFSYITKGIDVIPAVRTDGIDALIKLIS